MKVLFLFNDYMEVGGERQSVATEVDALRARGVKAELAVFDNAELNQSSAWTQGRSILGLGSEPALLEEILRVAKPDLVHAENLFPRLGATAVRAIGEFGVPWVRTFRNYRLMCVAGTQYRDGEECQSCTAVNKGMPGILHGCYRNSRSASAGALVQVTLDRRATRRYEPNAYISTSDYVRRQLENQLDPNIPHFVVPNAVSAAPGSRPQWSSRPYDAIYVGRLTPEKGCSLAIELARYLPHRRFAIAGKGLLSEEVREAAASTDNVDFLGEVSSAAARELMARARAVLVPSMWAEPFGRVSIEAQCAGAVPIVANVGGLPETLPGELKALAVDDASVTSWARALESALGTDGSMYWGTFDSSWVESYSPDALATSLIDIYKSVV